MSHYREVSECVLPRSDGIGSSARTDAVAAAIAQDARAATESDLAPFWGDLVAGRRAVTGGFFTQGRCGILLTASDSREHPNTDRRRLILDAALCGSPQTNIAIDLDVSTSTVAVELRAALRSMGVQARPSRVHPLLMLAAKASALRPRTTPGCVSELRLDGQVLSVVAVPRPDRHLFRLASASEHEVIAGLVEGKSYEEIAGLRMTAVRTVANQIASVFRRLGVSGRSELIHRLFSLETFECGWSLPEATDSAVSQARLAS